MAATIAASITQYVYSFLDSFVGSRVTPPLSPLDLTKVRLQASGDKGTSDQPPHTYFPSHMSSHPSFTYDLTSNTPLSSGMIASLAKTVRTAGPLGLFDGITGTWLRQMSYSVCRFWAYDESKKILKVNNESPPYMLALAGCMGASSSCLTVFFSRAVD